MANNPWDRLIINARERPLSSDINAAQSQLDRSLRELAARLFTARVSGTSDLSANPPSGFLGDSLKVRPPVAPGLSVRVAPGVGFHHLPGDVPAAVGGVVGLDDLSAYKPLPLMAEATIAGIPAGPAAGQDRYDIVEVRMRRQSTNPLSRSLLDVVTGVFLPGLVNKTLEFTLDGSVGVVAAPASSTAAVSYKVGSAVATGAFNPASIPPTTPGYVRVAVVYAKNGNMVSGVTRANLIDDRNLLCEAGVMRLAASFSVPSGAATPPTSVALAGPPGVELVVLKPGPNNSDVEVFLVGGSVPLRGAMSGTISRATASFTEANLLLPYGPLNLGTLSAAQVAALQDATQAAPAAVFAEGQPYASQKFQAARANVGTGVDGTIASPASMAVQATLQRY